MSARSFDSAIEILSRDQPPKMTEERPARVLLALGGEKAPIRALRQGHRFAGALGAELHVIRVVPPTARLASPAPNCVARALREAQRVVAAARHTRKVCDRVLGERIPIQQLCVRLGAFIDQVVLRAAELGATTIAVTPSRPSLGADAMQLVRQTGCAVLIPRGQSSFLTLVAATALQGGDTPVLRQAAQLAATLGATSVAVHSVVDTANSTSPEHLEGRRTALELATLQVEGHFEPVIVRTLDAAQGILDQARASSADLIIVGVRPERHSTSSPSTTADVIHGARRSVLVAPLSSSHPP